RVRASRVGWRHVDPPGLTKRWTSTEAGALAPPNTIVAKAGDRDVRVVMEPVWALSFRLVDAETGQPIKLEHAQIARRTPPPRPDQRWFPVGGDDDDWFAGSDPKFWAIRG